MKFYAEGVKFLQTGGTMSFDQEAAHLSPLATVLMEGMEGVEEVTIGESFVTIRRQSDALHWGDAKYQCAALLMDHLVKGTSHITSDAPHPHDDTEPKSDDSEVILAIKEVIRDSLRPVVQNDGGDLRFHEFRDADGVLCVELLGSCKRCKSSSTTLTDLIERTVRHWIPEVTAVVPYTQERKAAVAEAAPVAVERAALTDLFRSMD